MHTVEYSDIIRSIYKNRGEIYNQDNDNTLAVLPHFQTLANIDAVTDRLLAARAKHERICIVGDYDADGATSTVIAVKSLTMMGFNQIDYIVPNRFKHGYGFSSSILDEIKEREYNLLITVDNGITSIDAVEKAKELGIDVIITDHHMPGPVLPDTMIVNPNLENCAFPYKDLAGCGVIFYVMLALRSKIINKGLVKAVPLTQLLDLVAIGTIADCVPLTTLNRIICQHGLKLIREGRTSKGIQELIRQANISQQHIHAIDVAFQIAPKLNAAGRIDDMSLGVQCLMSSDPQTASSLTSKLISLNTERKQILEKMNHEASEQTIGQGATIAFNDTWHEGVIGILASRLKEQHEQPAGVFTSMGTDAVKGSLRSVKGIHLRNILQDISSQNPGMFQNFGGHAMAAGCTIAKNTFDTFKELFCDTCYKLLQQGAGDECVPVDGDLTGDQLSLGFADELYLNNIFGQKFHEPVFESTFTVQHIQQLSNGRHQKMMLSTKGSVTVGMNFFCSQSDSIIQRGDKIRSRYTLSVNFFRNQRTLQLILHEPHVIPSDQEFLLAT